MNSADHHTRRWHRSVSLHRRRRLDSVSAAANFATASVLLWSVNLMAAGLLRTIEATCSEDQRNTCSRAVTSDNWSTLVSGGVCIVKQYVYYTHLCTVSNYLPSVDYCCCVQDTSLLCCRYHQGWNHFRCVESDDVIELLEPTELYPPLEVLLPCILLPVLFVLTCVICCVRKCCFGCHGDGDNNKKKSASSRGCSCRRCYENLCGYELALDSDDVSFPVHRSSTTTTTYHCTHHFHQRQHVPGSDVTDLTPPTTVCTTDGQGIPYSTDSTTAEPFYYVDRPTPPRLLSPSAFCPDCGSSSLTTPSLINHNNNGGGGVGGAVTGGPTGDLLQVSWLSSVVEPSAPADLDRPVDASSSPSSSTVSFGLPRQMATPQLHGGSARRYRYVPTSSSSTSGFRRSFHGSGHSGRSGSLYGGRPYFRSFVPGGEGAFPVPPPAYDDS